MKSRIAEAIKYLAAIPFFPTDEYAQEAVMRELEKFVDQPVRLQWLVDAAINTMRKWEGVPELRGLYCTRYRPADGRETSCSLPGYSPADCEAHHAIESAQIKQLKPRFMEKEIKRIQ